MPRVLKRPDAEADLIEIWMSIAQDSIPRADAYLGMFEEHFGLLASQPHMGRKRPELGVGIRSFPIDRYVSYYLPLPDGIDIVRVLHGARDVLRLFRQGD